MSDNTLKFSHEGIEVPFLKDHEIKKQARKGDSLTSSGLLDSSVEPSKAEQDEMVKKLVEMGASEDQAKTILKRTGWNVEVAASTFFEMLQR